MGETQRHVILPLMTANEKLLAFPPILGHDDNKWPLEIKRYRTVWPVAQITQQHQDLKTNQLVWITFPRSLGVLKTYV